MNDLFNELAKGLAQSATRRGALKKFGLGGLLLCSACLSPPTADAASGPSATITLNFTGLTSADSPGQNKPDASGAVGEKHFVSLVNGSYGVFLKSDGSRVRLSSMDDFWRNAGIALAPDETTVDPRMIYDPLDKRWYAAANSLFKTTGNNFDSGRNMLFAVSRSADPTEGWVGFRIDLVTNHENPCVGFNRDGVFIRAYEWVNKSGHVGPFTGPTVIVLPKADLLAQTPSVARMTVFNGTFESVGANPFPVVDMDGGGMPEIMMVAPIPPFVPAYTFGVFRRTDIVGSVFAPFLDVGTGYPDRFFFGASYSVSPPAPQPDSNVKPIDVGYPAIENAPVLKNGEIWLVLNAVDDGSGRGVIHWFRVSAKSNTIIEEGFIGDPQLTLFFPSIAVNGKGDVVIGFNGCGPGAGQYASSYAIVGKTRGAQTVFGNPILLKAGVVSFDFHSSDNAASLLAPWGDWSSTVVDPIDPYTFWTMQEWASGNTTQGNEAWSTQITALRVAP
jgi:hypothetical protein